MRFTSETLPLYLSGKFFLLGLRSDQSRKYLDPQRNKQNIEFALNHLSGNSLEETLILVSNYNHHLGELNDFITDEKNFFDHSHHPVDSLLHAVIQGRAKLAGVLWEQRKLRRTS